MTKDLKAMIRTDMDNSKERTDRLLAVKIAVQDFEEAKLKGNEKEIAQKEFAKEELTTSFRVQMKEERDRRETLLNTFREKMRRAAEGRDRQAMVQPPDQPGSEDEQPIRFTPRAEVEAERNRIEVPRPSTPVEESGVRATYNRGA